jgi:hypothetical protein
MELSIFLQFPLLVKINEFVMLDSVCWARLLHVPAIKDLLILPTFKSFPYTKEFVKLSVI